jgi:hypothetical protein
MFLLGGLIMRMSPRQQEQYYAAINAFYKARRRATEEIEWPTIE